MLKIVFKILNPNDHNNKNKNRNAILSVIKIQLATTTVSFCKLIFSAKKKILGQSAISKQPSLIEFFC